MTTRNTHSWALAALACFAAAGCSSTSVKVGGAPETSVRNCLAAAPAQLRVPASSVAVDSGTTPRDGVYAINLKVGPQARSAVCTVDENSAVLGIVYKRAE